MGAPACDSVQWEIRRLELSASGSSFTAVRGAQEVRIECPLAGEHQVENAVTAIAALEALGVDGKTIAEGIKAATWPGRLETIPGRPEVLLDGAHNPAGVRALAAHLKRFYAGRRIWLIYAAMRDKSLDEIAGILSPVADHVILTTTEMQRALRPAVLENLFEHASVEIASGVDEALDLARRAGEEDLVVITGSLMLVGAARGRLVR
jgi:dihydrofolate synthase/folylpolyglutamate synthase